jgi:hypothetical protein
LEELQKKAINRNMQLIIRDWSAANFMKGLVRKKTPSYKLEMIQELKSSFLLKPLVLIRDPYSTWKSNFENFQKYFDLIKRRSFMATRNIYRRLSLSRESDWRTSRPFPRIMSAGSVNIGIFLFLKKGLKTFMSLTVVRGRIPWWER